LRNSDEIINDAGSRLSARLSVMIACVPVGCAGHLEPDQPLRLISADGFEPQASVIGDSLAAACH
jgi:hypothetical protein